MSDTLIIAEKPSVARDLARVVGATSAGDGFLRGNGYLVSWAIGHLVTLPEPHEIRPEWKSWRTDTLPMWPESWPLKIVDKTRDQFAVLKKLLREAREVICATDAGREGELIFRYIYEATNCRLPVKRLWISSLTPEAIRAGLRALKSGREYDSLADAARARSRADWLVGMNLSRAYAITYGDRFFVGRVQTPTLALVVQRDREIENFQPEDYWEVEASFHHASEKYVGMYLGELPTAGSLTKAKRFSKAEEAEALAKALAGRPASVHGAESKTLRQAPPLLYDLTELQRHANRLYGFSASRTLELAQALYERHKLISYPRTDSNHLSPAEAATLPEIVQAIRAPYEGKLKEGTGREPLGTRYVDESKVTDHHAILPTNVRLRPGQLTGEEAKIYDLVCRRLLQLWQGDYVTAVTTVLTAIEKALFRSQGTVVMELGWRELEAGGERDKFAPGETRLPKGLERGVAVRTEQLKPLKKTTRPPPPLSDASLLAAMETAGRTLDDRELQQAMKDSGLGTPATRAATIETLLAREYLRREGRALRATDLGKRLIDTVHPTVKSAELTGRWERELARIQAGKQSLEAFMLALQTELRARVAEVVASRPAGAARPAGSYSAAPPPRSQPRSEATAPGQGRFTFTSTSPSTNTSTSTHTFASPSARPRELKALLKFAFGFESFRPYQEDVCKAVVEGRDVLLVMPTGAGKSLCYQLPGLVRGGTTLVVSPLVALIDDQVEKLKRAGLRAERIHSGRKREESRAVCHSYLAGDLDYLFIAPERLAVPGFPEMLRKGRLALIAIDEAHCISHWGHDFRPEYRLLGERLGEYRPTPVIAVTATATPIVQEDIAKQLGLSRALHSIHGFRRTNIAIELAEMNPGARPDAVVSLLQKEDRLPAIVYAPTRKAAEQLADHLKSKFRSESYHAGMSASARDRVQEKYLRGDTEVIVATIAFGMGIDKANVRTVIHAALPGSVEGYYQEIGRAGRDGKLSRAVLFHSFIDRKTHEFFFEKSYPEIGVVRKVFRALPESGRAIPKDELKRQVYLDEEVFDRALEKLWIHKGALVDPEENVTRGSEDWEEPYQDQREHRLLQLRQIGAFTDSPRCRMQYLVAHFGDENDGGEACGICDVCRPEESLAAPLKREANETEQRLAAAIMQQLAMRGGCAVGRLHQEVAESLARRDFEAVIAALVQKGWLRVVEETFQKGKQTIPFRKLFLTEEGRAANGEELSSLAVRVAPEKAARKRRAKSKTGRTKQKRSRRTAVAGDYAGAPSGSLFEALREWRLQEARKKGLPAFRILTDAALRGICEALPASESDLNEVPGLGPALIKRYGRQVLQIVESVRSV